MKSFFQTWNMWVLWRVCLDEWMFISTGPFPMCTLPLILGWRVPISVSRSWFQCPLKKWTNLWRWNHGIPTSRPLGGVEGVEFIKGMGWRRKSQPRLFSYSWNEVYKSYVVIVFLFFLWTSPTELPKQIQLKDAEGWIMILPSAMVPYMKWPWINLQRSRWRHPTHYWLFGWKFCSWGYLKSCNYWPWYETLLTKHEIGSHHINTSQRFLISH